MSIAQWIFSGNPSDREVLLSVHNCGLALAMAELLAGHTLGSSKLTERVPLCW